MPDEKDDKTEELETEELETALENEDDEKDERTPGQRFFEYMRNKQLLGEIWPGEWDDLSSVIRKYWEEASCDMDSDEYLIN